MKFPIYCFLLFTLIACCSANDKTNQSIALISSFKDSSAKKTYDKLRSEISQSRKSFYSEYNQFNDSGKTKLFEKITDYWVITISNDLYSYWQLTPWDFNGNTTKPKQGAIACGFFVTTILQDMNVKINRRKLAICASSIMMKNLVPNQRLKNLSFLRYADFNEKIKEFGKGVYIIGLDYHTGFIINDGTNNWFVHSNYNGSKNKL